MRFADLHACAPDPAPYVAAGVPAWLDELDLRPPPPHLKMGTRGLDLDAWLAPDRFRDAELAIRARLLDEHRDDVFGALPGTEAASQESLALVTEWLAAHGVGGPAGADAPAGTGAPAGTDAHPPVAGSGHSAAAPATGGEHPLIAAGRMVQEDLCLMVRRDGGWHLDAAVLCFPTLWLLADKLGRDNAAVHAPVPYFAEELLARVDGFFDRLRPSTPVWRRNFSLMPGPLLCLAAREFDPPLTSLALADDGSPLWLRSERQTLRRLPESDAILFTIKVQIAPASVLRSRPDRARDLAAMYAHLDAAAHGYKMGGDTLVPALCRWLATIA